MKYTILRNHPLFLGMTDAEISSLLVKDNVNRECAFKRNQQIVGAGDTCSRLLILVDGVVQVTSSSDDNEYSFTELMCAPASLQEDRLFGLSQYYTQTFVALTPCNCLALTKQDVLHFSATSQIFRINHINILSAKVQKSSKLLWHKPISGIRQKIVRFMLQRVNRPVGEIIVKIKMKRLAEEISERRLNVSQELHRMEDERLIALSRNTIVIHKFQDLINS